MNINYVKFFCDSSKIPTSDKRALKAGGGRWPSRFVVTWNIIVLVLTEVKSLFSPGCRRSQPGGQRAMDTTDSARAWLVWALVVQGAVGGNPDAKRLYDDLLSNYNKLVRPVVNTTDVLRVCIKLKLSQLIDVVSSLAETSYLQLTLSLTFAKLSPYETTENRPGLASLPIWN